MPPLKISIVGSSGAGKSTLGARISERLGIAHLELDSVYHQAQWKPLDVTEFQQRVSTFMSHHERWVIDGNYSVVQPLIWGQATQVLWLDFSRMTFPMDPC